MASTTSKNTRNSRFVLSAHRHFQGVRCVDSCTRSRRGLLSRVLVSLLHVLYLFDDCAHSSLVPGHSLLTHCPGEARKRKDVRTSLSIALNDAHRGSTFHRANNARDLAAGFHITRENSRNIGWKMLACFRAGCKTLKTRPS